MNATHVRNMTNKELIEQARHSSDFLTFELGRRLAVQINPVGQPLDYPLFCPKAAPVRQSGTDLVDGCESNETVR